MSRINVLWIIDHICYDGSLHGGGRLYWNLLPRFDAESCRVVPCLLRADDQIRRLFENSPVPVTILDKGKFDPSTLTTILRLIRQEDIDVMHLHCYGAAGFGRLAGPIAGVPCIIHDYDTAVYFPYPWYLWLTDRLLAPQTRRAIAASPMVQDYFINRRAIPAHKISMAFHAIPAEKYRDAPPDRIAAARRQLGVEDGAPIVGTVTKLGPQRGNRCLLEAAALVLESRPDVVFVIVYKPTIYHRAPDARFAEPAAVAPESTVADLEALAKDLSIEDSVRFVEAPENVDDLLGAFDVFVAPFLSKRFSSVNLLEAMAMGKPIIATDLGEQKEVIKQDKGGRLVAPGDAAELAQRIADLAGRPDELGRVSREAREVADGYSVDAYVHRLETWYRELTAAPAGAGRGVPEEGAAR